MNPSMGIEMPDGVQHPPPDASESFRALVQGRVQGVGFRFFVVRRARQLGLTGMVRNLPDGRVEVWARGSKTTLQDFRQALRQGPALSRVDQVEVEWGVQTPATDEFNVGF